MAGSLLWTKINGRPPIYWDSGATSQNAVLSRRARLQEQLDRVDRIQAAHSLRSVAALV